LLCQGNGTPPLVYCCVVSVSPLKGMTISFLQIDFLFQARLLLYTSHAFHCRRHYTTKPAQWEISTIANNA